MKTALSIFAASAFLAIGAMAFAEDYKRHPQPELQPEFMCLMMIGASGCVGAVAWVVQSKP
jgi:hypothetical protein